MNCEMAAVQGIYPGAEPSLDADTIVVMKLTDGTHATVAPKAGDSVELFGGGLGPTCPPYQIKR
jgi:hypothetical protein